MSNYIQAKLLPSLFCFVFFMLHLFEQFLSNQSLKKSVLCFVWCELEAVATTLKPHFMTFLSSIY